MYGGWSIIRRSPQLELTYTNMELGSNLVYGCASFPKTNEEFKIATCTFNDKKIQDYNFKFCLKS